MQVNLDLIAVAASMLFAGAVSAQELMR